MKRDFLTKLGLEKDTCDAIMAEFGKNVEEMKQQLSELQDKLTAAEDEKLRLYNDSKAAEEKHLHDIEKCKLDIALKQLIEGAGFASSLAMRAAESEILDSVIFEDGKIVNSDEIISSLKEKDPGAFAPEELKLARFTKAINSSSADTEKIPDFRYLRRPE